MDSEVIETVKLTDNAKTKIVSVLDEEDAQFLRFGLQGGGCSGFKYVFTFENDVEDTDFKIEVGNNKFLIIDSMSMMYVTGSEIDYKKDLLSEQFIFKNPNTVSKCGCGSSVGF